MTQITNYIEVVEDLVDRMRDTANILSIVETATLGTYLVTVDDLKTIRENKYSTISGTTNFNESYSTENVNTSNKTFEISGITTGFSTETGEIKTDYPYFLYGHLIDIVNKIGEKNKSSIQKSQASIYPLVILPLDVKRKKGSSPVVLTEMTINPIICMRTNPDYDAEQRKDNSFDPILTPLEVKFDQALIASPYIIGTTAEEFEHDATDRNFWGRQAIYGVDGGILDDHLDAIEIENVTIKIRNQILNCN